jgi:hypothetical protein
MEQLNIELSLGNLERKKQTVFTTQSVLNAIQNKHILLSKNVFSDTARWSDMLELYNIAENKTRYISFGAMSIDNSENYIKSFDKIIEVLSEVHPGKKIAAMSIVHFLSRHTNELEDSDGSAMRDQFFDKNPEKRPEKPVSFNEFVPTIHLDPVDGFYIQGNGSTLWRIYENDIIIEEYTVERGDVMFIPKDLVHSVESLCPRHAVSIAFQDKTS